MRQVIACSTMVSTFGSKVIDKASLMSDRQQSCKMELTTLSTDTRRRSCSERIQCFVGCYAAGIDRFKQPSFTMAFDKVASLSLSSSAVSFAHGELRNNL